MLTLDQLPETVPFTSLDDGLSPGTLDAFPHRVILFRNFKVWPASRLLMRSGEVICIGSRAFDLLVVLLERRGSVVSKAELLKRVWPSTTVDESNLRFQIATLRKALKIDRDLVKSVPGRGYFFAYDPKTDAALTSAPHKAADWSEPSGPAGTTQSLDDDLRSRFEGGTVEMVRHNDKVVDLFVHFARQLVSVYGTHETTQEALSAVNG
jgi:DNA-binding winged helix-turn-helix (wHTH) protein